MKQVHMLELKQEWNILQAEIRKAVDQVLVGGRYINGPEVSQLEQRMCEQFGASHAVAVSSGTDALLCSMMALEIGAGDEVIIPSFTFFATAGAVHRLGATPVFVDIDPQTFTMDPQAVEAAVTDKTRAIIAVQLFGQCADMDAINAIAQKHGLTVIEDAAQAIGAKYKDRFAGTLGTFACFSFYPTKNLGGFGEGGMIFGNDEKLATLARQLRNHGESQRYVHERVGGNFRLDTMKAAILLVKLRYLDRFTQRRREIAAQYNSLLAETPVITPKVPDDQVSVYHQYSMLVDRRDALSAHLREQGIDSGVYYPIGLHLQKCFSSLGYKPGSLPVTEQTCEKILSLPCHPMMSDDDVVSVADNIKAFYSGDAKTGGAIPSQQTTSVDR